jgi:hypothetical protein
MNFARAMVIYDAGILESLADCEGAAVEFRASNELSHRHGYVIIAFPSVRVYKIGYSDRLP